MGNISQNKDLDSVLEKYLLTNRIVRKQINFQGCAEIPVTEDTPADDGKILELFRSCLRGVKDRAQWL